MADRVVVVGASWAGLCLARRLRKARVPVIALESCAGFGATETIEGFHLDRGLPLLFAAQLGTKRELRLTDLGFRPIPKRFLIRRDGAFRECSLSPFAMLRDDLADVSDALRWLDLVRHLLGSTVAQLWHEPDIPSFRYFRRHGFSSEFVEGFVGPLAAFLVGDGDLQESSRVLCVSLKAALEGDIGVPSLGETAIWRQLAAGTPIRFGARVAELVGGHRISGVRLSSGETVEACAVVVAAGGADLVEEAVQVRSDQVFVHFETPTNPCALVALNADIGKIRMVVPLSRFASERAPNGRYLTLVEADPAWASDRSDEAVVEALKEDLAWWFPSEAVDLWRSLRVDRAKGGRRVHRPGFQATAPSKTPGRDGLYVASKATEYDSLEGALRAASICANLVLEDIALVNQ